MADVSGSITIHGLKELDEALRALPPEVSGPITLQALRAAGEVIRAGAVANIDSRTGKTAADIRMEVQMTSGQPEGVAAIGGTTGKTGRAHILRWLEFGTGAHKIVAGQSERREARRASRALTQIGERKAAAALRRSVRTGAIRVHRALRLPGGIFRRAVQHPGMPPEAPLTRSLAEHGDRAIDVLATQLWAGIVRVTRQVRKI